MPILIITPTPCLTLSVTPMSPSFEHLPRQCPEGHQKGAKLSRRGCPGMRCAWPRDCCLPNRRGRASSQGGTSRPQLHVLEEWRVTSRRPPWSRPSNAEGCGGLRWYSPGSQRRLAFAAGPKRFRQALCLPALPRCGFVIRKQIEVLHASTCRGRQTALAGKSLHMLTPPLKALSKSFGPP